MKNQDIGKFYQGQTVSIVITTPEDATEEEKLVLAENDLFLGIYGSGRLRNRDETILSTEDGSLIKEVNEETGMTTIVGLLSAHMTKEMEGEHFAELLLKNRDNTFTSPCENLVTFEVVPRRLSTVIHK